MTDRFGEFIKPNWNKFVGHWESRAAYLADIGEIPRPAVVLMACQFCQSEICNGGFLQLFSNSTGMVVPEAIEGFQALGMPATAALIRDAASCVGSPYPRDRDARHRAMAALSKLDSDLSALDDLFYQNLAIENGGFEAAATRYVRGLRGAS
ncbi:MAG TPA: DUF4375 domain-containing protein [Acidobacteriaceae bacterium]|nr:DUF4375 domain-containing protein [Acidobacteriaceae bacterium]